LLLSAGFFFPSRRFTFDGMSSRICSLSIRLVQGIPMRVSIYNLELYWPSNYLKRACRKYQVTKLIC
jgi:hypothetical protein